MKIDFEKINKIYGKDILDGLRDNLDEVNKNIKYLYEIGIECIEEVFEFIINSASILTLTKEEIEKRVEIIKLLGEDIVKNGKFNSVFGMNKTRLNKKLNSYKDNDVIYPLIEEYIVR